MSFPRRPGHLFACLLLLWISADFMDPFTPGVFFFGHDAFFVDGAIQARSNAAAKSNATTPTLTMMPSAGAGDTEAVQTAVKASMVSRPAPAAVVWKDFKHDDSTSFASSSSPDSEPLPAVP